MRIKWNEQSVIIYHFCIVEMKGFYKKIESNLPKLEDLQGAAQGLMRLQDVYSLQLEGMVKGHFQRVSNGTIVDIYKPSVCISLSGDDCFLVGKVGYLESCLGLLFCCCISLGLNMAINWTSVFYVHIIWYIKSSTFLYLIHM